jgi:hypothetical protein
MDTITHTRQAYEMLGVVVDEGFKDAYIEVIGGGDLGVTIPNLVGGTCHALITVDFGLGLWNKNEEIIEVFGFDDESENPAPLWEQTANAVKELRRYLESVK